MNGIIDIIEPEEAGTIAGLFRERVRRSPGATAYLHHAGHGWVGTTWGEMLAHASRWQEALRREGLLPGDRVAVMLRNCREWVLFDVAAAGLGLVTVPLFVNDRAENAAHILAESGSRLLLLEGMEQWEVIERVAGGLREIRRIVTLERVCEVGCDPRLIILPEWLPAEEFPFTVRDSPGSELASIVYTSGTTGLPKGVMLSHENILENARAGIRLVSVFTDDLFLSFLPLSHTLERTVGYYTPMMTGACVAFARSIQELTEDLETVRPTLLISVPRVFERAIERITSELDARPRFVRWLFQAAVTAGWQRFEHRQGRTPWSPSLLLWPLFRGLVAERVLARFGGRLRVVISGGAPLSPSVSRVFVSLGLSILQGYGLTEASPVVSVNTADDNRPATVGVPIPGVEVRVAANGELLVRGKNVMLGYWENREATAAVIDPEGWLHTGDQGEIDRDGHIRIVGRLKEIIVLSSGEKVPPEDIELAIGGDPLIEQALVVGEGRPYLAALVVLNREQWQRLAARLAINHGRGDLANSDRVRQLLLERIGRRMARFPGYARIRAVHATLARWSVTDGLLTATLKTRRREILRRYAQEVEALYDEK